MYIISIFTFYSICLLLQRWDTTIQYQNTKRKCN